MPFSTLTLIQKPLDSLPKILLRLDALLEEFVGIEVLVLLLSEDEFKLLFFLLTLSISNDFLVNLWKDLLLGSSFSLILDLLMLVFSKEYGTLEEAEAEFENEDPVLVVPLLPLLLLLLLLGFLFFVSLLGEFALKFL